MKTLLHSHFIAARFLCTAMLMLNFAAFARAVNAQANPANPVAKAGKYAVELRLPSDGLYAENESDVELRVTDASQDDPVQGPPPIVNAEIKARLTMPSMAAMPAQLPKTHREGVPGDYGVVMYFPHGGDYKLALTITPPNNAPFAVSFALPVGDASTAKNRKSGPKPYSLEVVTSPALPRAGEPCDVTLFIRSRETGQPVADFETVHTKPIHFMIVSRDLQQFAHEHPEVGEKGRFTLRYTFPTGGEYHLFADVAPRNAGSLILMSPIKVAGREDNPAARMMPALSNNVDAVTVTLTNRPESLPIGRTLNLTFTLRDAKGATVTDLQPYLGAMAHLMLIQEDGVTFVHSHPDETDPANGHNGSLTFLARFPKPGWYRGWLQFQRNGQVSTAAFTWEVKAPKG